VRPMLADSSRLVRGLTCVATCLVAAFAHGQAAPEPVGAPRSDALLAENSNDRQAPDDEREYVTPAPIVNRPGPCQPEMQARIRIAGTVYDARHPERSMVMLGAASSPNTAVYRQGSRYGSLELLEVRPHAVLLSSDHEASPCWLRMMRPDPNAATPAHSASAAAPKAESKRESNKAFSEEELQQGIRQLGPGVYQVSRSILEHALARAPKLARTTRTKTVKKNGTAVATTLARIERGGLFEHLGLKKGDVLKTVNGFDMSSVDGLLSARTQLGSAKRLSLALTRGGQPMTLEYRVQ
jgi:type II secretory pathway component PulC